MNDSTPVATLSFFAFPAALLLVVWLAERGRRHRRR